MARVMRLWALDWRLIGSLLVGMALAAPAMARAQDEPRKVDARHGAAFSLFGGAASGSPGTGGALGWSVGWVPTARIAIEGSGWWTAEPSIEGFSALVGPRISLAPPSNAMPFVSAEIGLFSASVDATTQDVPSFYLDRMEGGTLRQSFDDFVFAAGGGIDLYVNSHVSIRPHLRILMITADSTMRAVAVYGVHVSYNFLEHPAEP